jgi:hypothetical protein
MTARPPHTWNVDTPPGETELADAAEWLVANNRRNGTAPQPADPLPPVIRDGKWHKTMVSAAGTLRRRGFSEQAAVAALAAENAEKYEGTIPADSDQELADLVADVYGRYQAVEGIPVKRERHGGRATLTTVLKLVCCYLDIAHDERDFLVAALATGVSKALVDEEPLWLLLVGASGGGKTEAIRLLADVADERVDELTRAGLLSWAPGKRAKRVGLLTRIPATALVTISDFSTVVTMGDREARSRMFGMLRVVDDGRVYRSIGGQPAGDGDELAWEGHLTLIAGATPVVDTHTSFEGALGERWIMLRLAESDAKRARERARFVVDRENAAALRAEAQAAAGSLVRAARERIPARLSDNAVERLVDVATFVAHARTGVVYEGQGKHRTILGIPTPEEPTRLVGQLHRLARCTVALGVDEARALELAIGAALDSVPLARMRALEAIADITDAGLRATVSDVQRALRRGNWWGAKWECDALAAIGLVTETRDGEDAIYYELATAYRPLYESVGFSCTPLSNEGNRRGRAYTFVEAQTRMAPRIPTTGFRFERHACTV